MVRLKRIVAVILTATAIITALPVETRAAQDGLLLGEGEQTTSESTEAVESTESLVSTEEIESTEALVSTEEVESTETLTDKEEENTENVEDQEQGTETVVEEEYLIQYLMVNESNVAIGATQQIVLGIGCDKEIQDAVLQYHKQDTGESYQQYYTEALDGAILFEILFDDLTQTGTYQLDAVTFNVEGNTYTEYFSEAGIEAVFGVNQEIIPEADAIIEDGTSVDEEVDVDIIRIDENGETVSETTLGEAIDNARTDAGQASLFSTDQSSNIVVVLDPGHDNTHAGAQANGLGEEDLNLKIAAYCKAELEQYHGVTVYLTRGLDGSCPYPGTTSGQCNENRVNYAQSVGANIFVSLHNNSASNTSAHGATVYYPNANYNSWVSEVGKGLAQQIENQLVALGLYNRGITIRDSQDYKYPDNSTADYYAVIRNCKKVGIPAIIVEHAFVSNTSDVNNFLSSDEKLKELGVADATAIASYYGLSKVENITVTAGAVQVSNVNNTSGTAVMSVSNVAPSSKISKVSFAVWSASDQSDLVWYDVANSGTGNFKATLDISKHKYNYGKYYVDAYAYDIYGISHYIGGNTCTFTLPKTQVTAVGNATQTSYKITAAEVSAAGGIKSVKMAVWSSASGQDDLVWYTATKSSTGTYVVDVPISNHKTAGTYYVDAYLVNNNDVSKYIGGTTFEVDNISAGSISIKNVNSQAGTFDVVIKDVISASGIQQIKVPVWSQADMSDLYWYIAEKQSDGSYVAQVNIANHKYIYGNYYVDVYGVAGNGISNCLGGKQVNLRIATPSIKVESDAGENTYLISIDQLKLAGTPQSVRVAVWSAAGGQDDLIWYTATKSASGKYTVSVPIASHKTAGLYYADVYVTGVSGVSSHAGGTTFKVTSISVDKIAITNKSNGTGTFDVVLTGLTAKAGISKVQVPVWSKDDYSDIFWYTAEKQSDGSYVAHVNLVNHAFNYGTYYVDMYATAANGVYQYVGGKTVTMNVPTAKITATANFTETKYSLVASNVGIQGGVKSVQFAVWSKENGQDDLKWYTATNISLGTWTGEVTIADHKTAGTYYVDTYAVSAAGSSVYLGGTTFKVNAPSVSSVSLVNYNEADGTFGVQISGAQSVAGIASVKVAVWSSGNQSDLLWYDATAVSAGTYQIGADIRNHQNNTGMYYADAYITDNNGIQIYAGGISCSVVNVTNVLHPLMGSNSVTVAQMVNYYNSVATYPAFYANTEAPTIEAFCRIYLEECQAEGVKAEVAFCQAMKETGFLRYGGNVSISQYNFGGIGSTGAGVAGESYSDVRTGIRAQVQHLKAYGCSDPLNQTCVDTRFKYVTRNTAPYVEWLGIQENPYGKGWATAKNYGYDIVNMVNKLKSM